MALFDRIAAALGLSVDRREVADRETGVTLEYEPARATEAAVKGLEVDERSAPRGTSDDGTEDAGDERGPEPAPGSRPVEVIDGIGSAYAGRLESAGVATLSELAAADPEELADVIDVSPVRIERWIGAAQERRTG